MIPQSLISLDALPLLSNGKLDRRALPAPEEVRTETTENIVAARTPVEEVVAGIWAEVLQVERIGVHDDFFHLGGHSLLATQVTSRIREAFHVDVALRQLFEFPTVADFAHCVEAALRAQQGVEAPPIENVSREQQLPLSFAQQRLWFIDQLEPNSSLYNIPAALRLTGQLDIPALEQTLSEVVRRHEVLRTTFAEIDGEPVQIIHEAQELALPVVKLSGLTEDEREAEVRRLSKVEAQTPFDLSAGPLLRVSLLKLADDEHVLLFTLHHIISDGWSLGVLIHEVAALYQAFTRGEESPLPELEIQYADFAAWQREWLQGGALERQLSYWREQLQDAPAVLELPTDRPRSAMQTHRGSQETFVLPSEVSEQLKALSRRAGATLFMTLLAAWQTLLARYSGQTDIVVGADIANRNRRETEELIGFFVNMLVLRTSLAGDPTFDELMKRVREVTLGAYAHQDVPFEKLVEELQPERDLSHAPLFQVLFVLQNAPGGKLVLPGLELSEVKADGGNVMFDLILDMQEVQGRLGGILKYNTDLFDAETIVRMIEHFQILLKDIAAAPESRLSELRLVSAEERDQILVSWNDTAVPYPREKCVHELFEEQAATRPDAVAIIFNDERITYAELNKRANQLAHYLRRLGVAPDMLVGLCMERSIRMVVALLGILKAGGAYVPLDPQYPMERLAFMLADAAVPVMVTQEELLDELPAHWAQVISLDAEWELITEESDENPASVTRPENLAYINYTSGSTGRPKGVEVAHHGISRLLFGVDYVHLEAEQTLLQASPVTFDASTFEIWGALLHGARLILFPERIPTASALRDVITRHRVTTMWLTSSLFNAVIDEDATALRGLKQLLVGGEALSVQYVRRALEQLPEVELINCYGPTENTTFTCCYPMTHPSQIGNSISIGRPISNTQVYILDESLQPVPVGVAGELYTGGDGLARGYLNRPELTAERFVPNPFSSEAGARLYQTGDVVRHLSDGNIEFIGRRDDQVKVRGFRIELGEIESALSAHATVSETVVVVREDVPGDKRLVAYLVTTEPSALIASELRAFLKEKLPDYMVPQSFVTLEALPLSPNGKVDRRALPTPEQTRTEVEDTYVAPRSPVEEGLARIWSEVLGVERIGVYDDFFELGGHSLLATQVISRVRDSFQIEIALRQMFESPTIDGLSTAVEQAQSVETEPQSPAIVRASRETRRLTRTASK
jgi:amino acid adenylation domain-containing protein